MNSMPRECPYCNRRIYIVIKDFSLVLKKEKDKYE